MQDSNPIIANMRKSNQYMKRFFWLLLLSTGIQVVQHIRLFNEALPWQNMLLSILISCVITIVLLLFLFKSVQANSDFLARQNTSNLVRAVAHESSFYKTWKIATWVAISVLIGLMILTLSLKYGIYTI